MAAVAAQPFARPSRILVPMTALVVLGTPTFQNVQPEKIADTADTERNPQILPLDILESFHTHLSKVGQQTYDSLEPEEAHPSPDFFLTGTVRERLARI